MEKDLNRRVKLGVFVTTALFTMLVAIYFVGRKQHLFGTTFRISGTFVDVGGLQVGNNVRFAGVNVGSVEGVTITSNNSVRIDMLIDDAARKYIKKDAVASVGSESMMGNKLVMLSPGSDSEAQVANHDVIHTAVPISFDDILKHLNRTGENAALISDNLAGLTSTIRAGKGTFGKIFMDKRFADDVSATMVSLKGASAGLNDLLESAHKSWLMWGSGKSQAEKKQNEVEKMVKEEKEKKKEIGDKADNLPR